MSFQIFSGCSSMIILWILCLVFLISTGWIVDSVSPSNLRDSCQEVTAMDFPRLISMML